MTKTLQELEQELAEKEAKLEDLKKHSKEFLFKVRLFCELVDDPKQIAKEIVDLKKQIEQAKKQDKGLMDKAIDGIKGLFTSSPKPDERKEQRRNYEDGMREKYHISRKL